MERNCGNCDHAGTYRFYTVNGMRHEREEHLVCRRYPPAFVTEYTFDKPRSAIEWPTVHAEDRCGEFTPKSVAAAETDTR